MGSRIGAPISPEMREKLKAGRAAKAAARKASTLRGRDDFSIEDVMNWEKLASLHNLVLPPWGEPLTNRIVESWLRKVGVTREQYMSWDGETDTSLADFHRRNPTWPARAWCGLILENLPVIRGDHPAEPDLTLAEWVDYARANGINTPGLGRW